MIDKAKRKINCLHWRLKRAKEKHWQPIAPRYVGLMWISLLCVMMSVAYSPLSNLPAKLPPGMEVATRLLPAATDWWNPAWLVGAAWANVGVVGLITIFRRKPGEVVFSLQLAMLSYWALSNLGAFILGDPRAWVSAALFSVFAGLTWSLTRVDPPFRSLWRRFTWTRR